MAKLYATAAVQYVIDAAMTHAWRMHGGRVNAGYPVEACCGEIGMPRICKITANFQKVISSQSILSEISGA